MQMQQSRNKTQEEEEKQKATQQKGIRGMKWPAHYFDQGILLCYTERQRGIDQTWHGSKHSQGGALQYNVSSECSSSLPNSPVYLVMAGDEEIGDWRLDVLRPSRFCS